MIKFVNAKINLGLYVTRKRENGYHDLSTVFYPVGKWSGTPQNTASFCDILEVSPHTGEPEQFGDNNEVEHYEKNRFTFVLTGRKIDCAPEKNLIVKCALAFEKILEEKGLEERLPAKIMIELDKHLPDGAGMGGGSADAGILLETLNEVCGKPLELQQLIELAARLGADCPFFLINKPAYAEGIGERLQPIDLDLSGKWLAVIKPDIYVSTAEAFRGIMPAKPRYDLLHAIARPIKEWRELIFNDFETTIFSLHPELARLKEGLYRSGALYASMSGSGSSLYGIFNTREDAENAVKENPVPYSSVLLL